jgi:predicted enzyme related to lactoylglutathione lyase
MSLVKTTSYILVAATIAMAQESGICMRAVRVLATDPEAIATFYEKAFGMYETASTATFKEIVINSGSTVDLAKQATTTTIVIATRSKDAPSGALASIILQVPHLDKAIESVKRNGGAVIRPPNKSAEGLRQRPRRQSDRAADAAEIIPKMHSNRLTDTFGRIAPVWRIRK